MPFQLLKDAYEKYEAIEAEKDAARRAKYQTEQKEQRRIYVANIINVMSKFFGEEITEDQISDTDRVSIGNIGIQFHSAGGTYFSAQTYKLDDNGKQNSRSIPINASWSSSRPLIDAQHDAWEALQRLDDFEADEAPETSVDIDYGEAIFAPIRGLRMVLSQITDELGNYQDDYITIFTYDDYGYRRWWKVSVNDMYVFRMCENGYEDQFIYRQGAWEDYVRDLYKIVEERRKERDQAHSEEQAAYEASRFAPLDIKPNISASEGLAKFEAFAAVEKEIEREYGGGTAQLYSPAEAMVAALGQMIDAKINQTMEPY